MSKNNLRGIRGPIWGIRSLTLMISCSNILPLNFQYCKSVCTIMHDVSNNSLPANISNLFLYPTQVHSHNTRFSEIGNLNIKYSGTNHLKHSFSILVQGFGTAFLRESQCALNINLKILYISSFYLF